MTPRGDMLGDVLETGYPLFDRFLVGFTDENRVLQPAGLVNHAAWTLGHLALYHHRAADRLLGFDDPRPLPAEGFVQGNARSGDAHRFDTESVCYGSVPVDDPAIYPVWTRCMSIHREAWDRLVRTVRGLDDPLFDRPVPWGSTPFPGERLVTRMLFHLATHTGQLVDLRRAMELPPVVG